MKNIKGFTLIELVVTMAILVIIMSVAFSLFTPVNKMYDNSIDYDTKSTSMNGVNNYISESIKYAKCVYIFDNVSQIDLKKLTLNGVNRDIYQCIMLDAGLDPNNANDIKKVQVIALDTSTRYGDTWRGTNYTGRVLRARGLKPTNKNHYITANSYKAMGSAYYGRYDLEFKTEGVIDEAGTPTLLKTEEKRFVLTITATDDEGKSDDFVKVTDLLNTSNGYFCYYNMATVPPTEPIDPARPKRGNLAFGDNTYIVYINP